MFKKLYISLLIFAGLFVGGIAAADYCTPSTWFGSMDGDFISRVKLENLDHVSANDAPSPHYYIYHDDLTVPELYVGRQYTLTVRVGTVPSFNYVSAWMDFNGDQIFQESERLGNSDSLNANEETTFTFTVPADTIFEGNTRLRVREMFIVPGMDACQEYSEFGETEDYLVNISAIEIENPAEIADSKTITANFTIPGVITQAVTDMNLCDATHTYTPYQPLTFSSESDNGTYVCYRAEDNLGNIFYKKAQVSGIDTEGPVFITPVTPLNTYLTTNDVTFSWDVIDTVAGIQSITYMLATDEAFTNITHQGSAVNDTQSAAITLDSNTKYRVKVTAEDNIGHKTIVSGFIANDTIAPIINSMLPVNGTIATGGENVQFSWNVVEAGSITETSYIISRSPSFDTADTVMADTSDSAIGFNTVFSNSGDYFRKVSVKDAAGRETTSDTLTFTIVSPVAVNTGSNGTGSNGTGTGTMPDICPNGDKSGNFFDNKCDAPSGGTTCDNDDDDNYTKGNKGGLLSAIINAIKNGKDKDKDDSCCPTTSSANKGKGNNNDKCCKDNNGNGNNNKTWGNSNNGNDCDDEDPKPTPGFCKDKEEQAAYEFGFKYGWTTKKNCIEAFNDWELRRRDVAKMVAYFATEILNKKPNKSVKCTFSDMKNESSDVQKAAIAVCQLGLMGIDNNGKPSAKFEPNTVVTKDQFVTIISRLLYGNKYENKSCWYCGHFDALNKFGYINSRDNMFEPYKKGWSWIMLMRIKK